MILLIINYKNCIIVVWMNLICLRCNSWIYSWLFQILLCVVWGCYVNYLLVCVLNANSIIIIRLLWINTRGYLIMGVQSNLQIRIFILFILIILIFVNLVKCIIICCIWVIGLINLIRLIIFIIVWQGITWINLFVDCLTGRL